MGLLTLVRHAQASFFSDHYDRLSPVGEDQARLLGEYWIRSNRQFDEVYVGPRDRQRQTAELVADRFHREGLSFPNPTSLRQLDEYDLDGILKRLAPALASENQEFAVLCKNCLAGETDDQRFRSFQKMFEPLMVHWLSASALKDTSASADVSAVENASAVEDFETWLRFRQRVKGCLEHMVRQPGNGRRIVAFTSGGFIGTAVQLALGAPDRTALELNWRIPNTSVTELLFSSEKMSLDSFNGVPHFVDRASVTFR